MATKRLLLLVSTIYLGNVLAKDPLYIYVTNLTSVYRIPLNPADGTYNTSIKPEILYQGNGYIRSLEIDEENKHLYWADFLYNRINQSSLDGKSVRSVLTYAIGYAAGLAIDWSSNILYWTDSIMKLIELSKLDGSQRKVLFKLEDQSEPRGLVADPVHGYLFWTDFGKQPKIERSTLSGENRIVIVSSDIKWPNDLAIDYKSSRLYWVDAFSDKIESVDFNGNDRRLQVELKYHQQMVHPYSIAFLAERNMSYISDWYSDSLYVYDPSASGTDTAQFVYKNSNKIKTIGQVRITGQHNQTAAKPCFSEQSKCSHLCLKSINNSFKCACPNGMVANGITQCVPAERDFEIYFADSYSQSVNHLIKYKNQDGFTILPLSIPSNEKLEYPVALDYHAAEKFIYWIDSNTRKLYRMHEDRSGFEVVFQSATISGRAMAIDQITNILYFYDKYEKAIIMSSLDGKIIKIFLRNIGDVHDITLYEEKGYLYFAEYKTLIGRVNTDGSDLHTNFVTRFVTGLAIDKIEDRIYICYGRFNKMESTNLSFGNKRLLIQKTVFRGGLFWLSRKDVYIVSPQSMAIRHDKIYWTDTYKRAIFEADKRFGGPIKYVTGGLHHPRDLHVINNDIKSEKRKTYLFSIVKRRRTAARCFVTETDCMNQYVPDPKTCPPGYKETRTTSYCGNCSEALGVNFVCPCTNWHTCAQRTYGNVRGCFSAVPFMKYKVRECEQVVKPGYCSYNNSCPVGGGVCTSDDDCSGSKKCCRTKCGMKCSASALTYGHPCSINNGGCSHFCLNTNPGYKCTCPAEMHLFDEKRCVPNTEVCALPKVVGLCRGRIKRYYFNSTTKTCETFNYGGCRGNANNFMRENNCLDTCTGICPKHGLNKTCASTNDSCMADSDCPSVKLCCNNGCRKSCVSPVPFNICNPTKCKNDGKCTALSRKEFYCICPIKRLYWIGKTCSLDLRKNPVTVVFSKKSNNFRISLLRFREDMASYFTDYCKSNRCTFVEERNGTKTRRRRRRESPPIERITFTAEDLYVPDFSDTRNEMMFKLLILKPLTENNVRMGYLSQESTITGLNVVGPRFASQFQLEFQTAQVSPYTNRKERVEKNDTKQNVLIAVLVVLIVLLIAAMLFFLWMRRSKRLKKTKGENTAHASSFENQLYNDLNTNIGKPWSTVDLVKADVLGNQSSLDETATKPPTEVAVKKEKEMITSFKWVKFENEKKPSVNDCEKP